MYKVLRKWLPLVKPEASGDQYLNISIVIQVKSFKYLVHFIIINGFNCILICVWNKFRGAFQCIIWRANLYITILNSVVIDSPRDIWNHMAGIGIMIELFEVNLCLFLIPLS